MKYAKQPSGFIILLPFLFLLLSLTALGQPQPGLKINQPPVLKTNQIPVFKTFIPISTFNKSISPKYIESTKKFLKTNPKSNLSTNTGATPKITVALNKGGVEGSAPSQTTSTEPARTGDYTCITRNVNEKTDYFRQPLFSQGDVIYPGALFNAALLINNQMGYYSVPASYQRQPYRISANLFTMTGTPQNPTEMIGDNEDYSLASYRNALSTILNRNAQANPPVEAFIEYIQATTREEVAIKLGYNFSANIPAEISALIAGVPVGVNANVSVGTIASQVNEKSRIILKVNYNFFSVNASPTNDDSKKFLSPQPGIDIPTNVVFVSSVLYGTTGYVYFESDKSASELQATIEETIGVAGPLNQGSASLSINAETRAKFSSTVTKMVAFGKGLGLPPGSSMPVASLDNLLNLIGNLRSWGASNQGSPIAYTMNFLNDGVQALVSYSTQFPNKVCTQTPLTDLLFDVDLELDHIVVNNVRDLDGTEDLYGQIDFTNLKAGGKTVTSNITFFSKSEDNANSNNYRNGNAPIDKRFNLIKNLTFDELRNIELTAGGKLYDDEGIFGSRVFKCNDCSSFSGDYGTRELKFIELSITQTSINTLANNGNFQNIKFGDDNFFELNFYESNNKNDGWVKFMWKVWVKPH
ncbi:MAG: thiol-activated cytolysin family protein [Chitinophagaceae bacterium]|nr:thiol-activated cytolysin family protein [Chitinophagaceae bacterium]